jgi:transglutaminase-like putative cysteine protease
MQPRHDEWQDRRFFTLRVLPAVKMRRYADLNSNWVSHFEIEEPHTRLIVDVHSTVITRSRYTDGEPTGVFIDSLTSVAQIEEIHPFLQPTRYVCITPEIWRAAVDARDEEPDVFLISKAIMSYTYSRCSYVPNVTGIETRSIEVFENPQGVCQDFTHLMLAMCRGLRIPARYVSGYLYDAKRKNIRGAHASHAWVDVYVAGRGWFGLDPTNNRMVGDDYIVVATGTDYEDIAPIKGTLWGTGNRQMHVTVDVNEV